MTIKDKKSDESPQYTPGENAEPLEPSPGALIGIAVMCITTALILLDLAINVSRADFEFYTTFQEPEAFLEEVFDTDVPPPQTLVLDDAARQQVRAVFGRDFPQRRLRYWRLDDNATVWIFDDIGKEGYVPTTSGFVIRDGVVERARVLIYRESRGEEVGENYFLQQLMGARAEGNGLDQPVDNISGATYSVQMMQRKARTAIAFHHLVD